MAGAKTKTEAIDRDGLTFNRRGKEFDTSKKRLRRKSKSIKTLI